MATANKTKGARLCRDAWPTKVFDGKVYQFYVSRANISDVNIDRKALPMHGYLYRVWRIPGAAGRLPGMARYVVFKRKK